MDLAPHLFPELMGCRSLASIPNGGVWLEHMGWLVDPWVENVPVVNGARRELPSARVTALASPEVLREHVVRVDCRGRCFQDGNGQIGHERLIPAVSS